MRRMRKAGRNGWLGLVLVLVLGLAIAGVALRSPAPPSPEQPGPGRDDAAEPEFGGVPTGQPITYQQAILEPQPGGEVWLRLRFVAPRIGEGAGGVPFAEAVDDMVFLCREVGIAVAGQAEPEVSRIIVSLSAEVTEFGRSYPDVVQYFEQYRLAGGECIEEEF